MKRTFAARILVLLFVAGVALSLAGMAQASCSKVSVAGQWAFTTNGSIAGVGPVAAVGTYFADTWGNLKGSQTRSLNGAVADETFTGTATVNPDCSGTDVIQVFESGTLVRTSSLSVQYDENGRGVRAIFTSITLPDGTSLPTILTIDGSRVLAREDH